jgi:hypothetical protein
LVLLLLAIDLGNSRHTVTDNVRKMNRCTAQLKNKIVFVVELRESITFQYVHE